MNSAAVEIIGGRSHDGMRLLAKTRETRFLIAEKAAVPIVRRSRLHAWIGHHLGTAHAKGNCHALVKISTKAGITNKAEAKAEGEAMHIEFCRRTISVQALFLRCSSAAEANASSPNESPF